MPKAPPPGRPSFRPASPCAPPLRPPSARWPHGPWRCAIRSHSLPWLVAAALAAACTTRPVPGVCCIGPEDCHRLGLTEDRPCLQGEACVDFHCVAATCSTLGCPAEAPICDGDACRACRLDAECPSGACGDDGSCVEEAAVLYMSPNGLDTGACTRASPCKTLNFAATKISNERNHIVMENGIYFGTNSVGSAHTVGPGIHIHGNGSTLTANSTDEGPILEVYREGTIRDLKFTGVNIANYVIFVGTPLIVERVVFSKASVALNGMAMIRDFSIDDSIDAGMYLSGAVTVERGVIRGGKRGILGDASEFPVVDISNVLVFGTSGRALDLASAIGRVRFVTVANVGIQQGSGPHAVDCSPGLAVESSIIWAPGGFAQPPLAGGCTLLSTIVGPTAIPGATNIDPLFVDPTAGDYHLRFDSPARDMVNSGPMLDFEGDPRPRGERFDIGADEAP